MALLPAFLRARLRRDPPPSDPWRVADQVMRRRRGLLARLARGTSR